jgi:EmrB/QacA subfamily drug resistance transporter
MSDDVAGTLSRRQVTVVFAGLVMAMALAALDQTVVATALPTVVGDLGGIDELSWVVTAYLLASTATALLWGKIGDLCGRKPVLQVAIVVFLTGSALCGAAWSMPALIGFRALQGVGAGGLMSLAMAVVGDLVSPRERGRYQGYIQAVFALASVAGPLLGGLFTDHLTWRWAFYVNLPLGAAALAVIAAAFRAPVRRVPHRIDYAGAVLLMAGVSALQLMIVWGGNRYPWRSEPVLALAVAGIALLALFVLVQAGAVEPILPLRLFRDPVVVVVSGGLVAGTCSLFAATTFLPLYLQVVRGITATSSGLLLLPLMLGITAATTVSGRIISATGRYKLFPIGGLTLTTTALGLFAMLDAATPLWLVIAIMVLMGVGFGMVTQVLVLAIQNAVDRKELGTATAAANFFRSLGGSVGVAVFGGVMSAGLSRWLPRTVPPSAAGTPVKTLLDSPARMLALPPEVRTGIADGVSHALNDVFLTAAPIAALGVLTVLFLREYPLRTGMPARRPGARHRARNGGVRVILPPNANRRRTAPGLHAARSGMSERATIGPGRPVEPARRNDRREAA